MKKNLLGIYIHIPFCIKKCLYCNFYSVNGLNLIGQFVDGLCAEIKTIDEQIVNLKNYEVNSIYFGGGTPNLLKLEHIEKILCVILNKFKVLSSVEISFEFNPNLCTKAYLKSLFSLNINRLSIGVQSADDDQLKVLGRLHTFSQAVKAVTTAKEVGFKNISADLMIGIPNQSAQNLQISLNKFVALNLAHVSIYQLKIEEGTPFFANRPINLPNDDETAELFEQAINFFNRAGFCHYEVSNLAKKGFECVHNLKYWTQKPYLGFGPSAHSCFNGVRFYNDSNLKTYLQGCFNKHEEAQLMSTDFEWLMLISRLNQPILFSELQKHGFLTDEFKARLNNLAQKNLIVLNNDRFNLTTKGFLVQNSILIYLTK